MNNGLKQGKGAATIAVWIVTMITFSDAASGWPMQVFLVMAAMAATFMIWIGSEVIQRETEKAKRHHISAANVDENEVRLRVLMDMLDDEDKARIRAKLMNGFSDGELPVDELIEEHYAIRTKS
ncbi:MAG: hypothetical protein L0154_08650 [Chloroflexi bacterium]|nr:hypothetical protein [Chloroflexota bacterium]